MYSTQQEQRTIRGNEEFRQTIIRERGWVGGGREKGGEVHDLGFAFVLLVVVP